MLDNMLTIENKKSILQCCRVIAIINLLLWVMLMVVLIVKKVAFKVEHFFMLITSLLHLALVEEFMKKYK